VRESKTNPTPEVVCGEGFVDALTALLAAALAK
jgi:hypothetical protein